MEKKNQNMEHDHEIELIQYTPGHVHGYSTPTTVSDRHSHIVRGTTSGPMVSANTHVHYYQGTTTLADRHTHRFSGYTGPAIMLPDGSHYHVFSGQTTYDDGHIHFYQGMTGVARRQQ